MMITNEMITSEIPNWKDYSRASYSLANKRTKREKIKRAFFYIMVIIGILSILGTVGGMGYAIHCKILKMFWYPNNNIIQRTFYTFIDVDYTSKSILKSYISDWLSIPPEEKTTAVMQEVTATIPIEGKSFPYTRYQSVWQKIF